jgi:hypothetical protein
MWDVEPSKYPTVALVSLLCQAVITGAALTDRRVLGWASSSFLSELA